jgi:membrane protease subunit (stomatin/prohibitin family)
LSISAQGDGRQPENVPIEQTPDTIGIYQATLMMGDENGQRLDWRAAETNMGELRSRITANEYDLSKTVIETLEFKLETYGMLGKL